MNDNKSNVGGEAMDELIERLKKHAGSTEQPASAAAETTDGDDELRRLLLSQLEGGGRKHSSDAPKIDESLSLDEFEEEEEEPVAEESVEEETVEEETAEEETVGEDVEEDLIDGAEAQAEDALADEPIPDDYLDEDEIFEEDVADEELFDEEYFESENDETVTEEAFIEDDRSEEDELLVAESDEIEDTAEESIEIHADGAADEQVEDSETDEEDASPYEPAPLTFAPDYTARVSDEDIEEEEELPDEAQISIDLTEIDAFSFGVETAEDDEYIPRVGAEDIRAASTDTAINGITPDEVLLSTIAAQVDERTRARLLGIELIEQAPAVEEDEEESEDTDSITEDIYDDTVEENEEVTEQSFEEDIPVIDPLQTSFDNEGDHSADKRTTPWQLDGDGDIEDADVEMLLRLGYEPSLRRTVGDERVERIKQEKLAAETVDAAVRKPFAYRGREYGGRDMTAETQRAYAHDRAYVLTRLFWTAVFAFVLLIFDEMPLISDVSRSLWSIVAPFVASFAYPLIEAALLLLALAPSLPLLFGGVRGAVRLEANAYSIPAISAVIALANSIGMIFRGAGVIPSLFGGAAVVILLIAILSDLCALRSQELAFSVVSSGKEKFLASDGIYEGEGGTEAASCYNVRRANGMSSYFARTAKRTKTDSFLNYVIPVCFAASIIFGGFGLLRSGSFSTAVRAAVTAYFLLMPVLFALGTTLPLWLANKVINHHGCAVIGPAAAEDYTPDNRFGREKKIFFPDGDVLSAAHIKRITLRGDGSAEHYVALAEKLFYVLGGVLREEGVRGDEPPAVEGMQVEIADSSEHYLKLYVIDGDETVEVVMGSYDKLTRSGIKLPNENMERVYNDDRRDKLVVYIAFDGQFRVAYSIRYKLSSKFRRAVKRLAELGFVPSVETFDPMVTRQLLDELMAEARLGGKLSVCRADHFDSSRPRQSCGIVATKSSLNLYYPLASCRHIRKSYADAKRLSVILMCAGAVAMATVLACGVLIFVRPWMALVWQALGAGIFTLFAAKGINGGTLSMSPPVKKNKKNVGVSDKDKKRAKKEKNKSRKGNKK